MKKKMKKMNGERILDFEDVKERHEAERLANERCRKELTKLVSKKKIKITRFIKEKSR